MCKKRVIMASTVLAAACLSSACAGKTAQQVAAREQYQNESSQEESNQMKNRNKNTAAQTESASIDSYESVQKFGYELFLIKIQCCRPYLHIWRSPWQAAGRTGRRGMNFTVCLEVTCCRCPAT